MKTQQLFCWAESRFAAFDHEIGASSVTPKSPKCLGANIFLGRKQVGLFDSPVAVFRYSSVASFVVNALVLPVAANPLGFASRYKSIRDWLADPKNARRCKRISCGANHGAMLGRFAHREWGGQLGCVAASRRFSLAGSGHRALATLARYGILAPLTPRWRV